jgi:hypothetical protein
MKLLTHNFLQCHVKGVKNGYPLKIEAAKIEERDADYDPGDSPCAAARQGVASSSSSGSDRDSDACPQPQ